MLKLRLFTKFSKRIAQASPQNSQNPRPKLTSATKSGFTIIELTLTMSFVAVLLITISVVTSNIITIYQKGLTLKAVNSVGRSMIDEFTSAVNSAPTLDAVSLCSNLARGNVEGCERDHANLYVFNSTSGLAPELANGAVQYNGVFCTGRYSYIWNTHYGIASGSSKTLKVIYLDKTTGVKQRIPANDDEPFRLLRFDDPTRRVCSAVTDGDKYTSALDSDSVIDISELANSTDEVELKNPISAPDQNLLNEFDLDLLFYELTMFPISQDNVTNRTYIAGTFILATERGNVDITRSGDYCNVNDLSRFKNNENQGSGSVLDIGSEFNYCAINKFNFAARTAGVQ